MPDNGKTSAQDQASAEEISRVKATERGARGNTQSEPDDITPDQDAPPPMPH